MRKVFPINEISQKRPRQIIDDMSSAHYSLLRTLGCGSYNVAYAWVRFACLFFLNMARNRARKHTDKPYCTALKEALSGIFACGAPSYIPPTASFPKLRDDEGNYDCGLIIGFNHPSLGEIIRLMGICMRSYPDRKYLFPVNIIWFEALAPVIRRLEELDFYITPIITPSAKETLLSRCKTPEQKALVERLARGFSDVYVSRCAEFIADKQITLVAPSARRREHIFPDVESSIGHKPIDPQTMTLITASLLRKKHKFALLPVAVIPPVDASRGLNLLQRYTILPCPAISAQMAEHMFKQSEKDCKSRRLERYFLESIATRLRENGAGHMIIGPD